jgi:hypothetical protein
MADEGTQSLPPELVAVNKPDWIELIYNPGGAAVLAQELTAAFSATQAAIEATRERRICEHIGIWRKVISLRPELLDVYVWLADVFVRAGRLPDARQVLRDVSSELLSRDQPKLAAIIDAKLKRLQ